MEDPELRGEMSLLLLIRNSKEKLAPSLCLPPHLSLSICLKTEDDSKKRKKREREREGVATENEREEAKSASRRSILYV